MKLSRFLFCISFLLFVTQLIAYEDSDIDGVEDSIDLCPDTSFDKLVDENGCPEDEKYWGSFSLQFGNEISFDSFNERVNNYTLFGSYRYQNWNLSLSNTQQTTYDINNDASTSRGDLYLTTGYLFDNSGFQTKLSFGTKVALADSDVGTGENDYFTSLNMTYFINNSQSVFGYLSYSLNGDSEIDYQNSLGYSFGTGYLLNSNWYSSLSYDCSSSIYKEGEKYQALSFFNSYSFLENYFISMNYTYGLDEVSYTHTISTNLGVTFD